jgi:hypothetical protein
MANFKWTDQKTDELITMYQARPCLYNNLSDDYSNRDTRRKALEEIASAFGLSADDITKKWKNIRTIYSRERAKIKDKSGDGVDDVYVPKWVFFKKLEFLRDFVSARTSISNLQVGMK